METKILSLLHKHPRIIHFKFYYFSEVLGDIEYDNLIETAPLCEYGTFYTWVSVYLIGNFRDN